MNSSPLPTPVKSFSRETLFALCCVAALAVSACSGNPQSAEQKSLGQVSQAVQSNDLTLSSANDAGVNYYTATLPVLTVVGTVSQTLEASWDPAFHSTETPPVFPQGWTLDYYAGATKLAGEPTSAGAWASVSRVVATGAATVEGADGDRQALSSSITAPPVTVASSFSGGSAGDGWNVIFDPAYKKVYNIHHHSGPATIMCRNLSDSSTCAGDWPMDLTATAFRATGFIDEPTNKLWQPTIDYDGKVAWDCVDLTTNARCAIPTVVSSIDSIYFAYWDPPHFDPVVIGRKMYALALVPTGARISCLNMATGTECNGAQLLEGGDQANAGLTAIGNNLYASTNMNGKLDCIDSTTMTRCGTGTWPKQLTNNAGGRVHPVPDANGALNNICVNYQCFAKNGGPTTLPPNFLAYITAHPLGALGGWDNTWGGFTNAGTRVAWPADASVLQCWDLSTDTACSNAFPMEAYPMYSAKFDPYDDDCIWTNGDDGVIRNYKISTGAQGCSGGPPKISFKASVSIPRLGCDPDSRVYQYKSFKLNTPAKGSGGTTYTSATLTVLNSDGATIPGWANIPLPANATVDLSSLTVAEAGNTPTFVLTTPGFTDTSITPAAEFRVTTGATPQLCWNLSPPTPACPSTPGLAGNATNAGTTTNVVAKASNTLSGGAVVPYTDQTLSPSVSFDPPNLTNCGSYVTTTVQKSDGTPVGGVTVALLDSSGAPVLDGSNNPATTTASSNGIASFGVWASSYQLRVGTSGRYAPESMTINVGGNGTTFASAGTVTSGTVTSTRNVSAAITTVVSVTPTDPPIITGPTSGTLFNTRTPAVSGTCISGDTIKVYESSTLLCTTPCASAAFSCNVSSLTDGNHTVFATQTDVYATSANSNTTVLKIDASAPNAPTLVNPTASLVTNDNTPLVTGACESLATVKVYEGLTLLCTASCSASSYSCNSSTLGEGLHTLVARQTDAAGNLSSDSAARSFTVDTAPPDAPLIEAPTAGEFLASPAPTVAGHCETNATVRVYEGLTLRCSVPCTAGSFSCTSSALGQGSHTFVARQTDTANNPSADSAAVTFTVDTVSPPEPDMTAPLSGSRTNNTTPSLTGTCETDATVTVSEGATTLCTVTCAAGSFSCTSPVLTEGSHTVRATQADRAGNVDSGSGLVTTFVVDVSAPSKPTFALPTEGFVTATATPAFSGSCETNATVKIYDGSTLLCSATCTAGGYSCTSTVTLDDGAHALTAQQTDVAGNTSPPSDTRNIVSDTVLPPAPAVTAPVAGSYTADPTPALSGTCETGATVKVYKGSTLLCTASCEAAVFTCDSSALSDAAHTVFAHQTDAAGNTGIDSATQSFTIDTTLPPSPAIVEPSAAFLNDLTPTVSGTCESAATVSVYEGATVLCSAACISGTFSCTSSTLTEGTHTLVARQVDSAANTSGDSSAALFTVDITLPAAVTLVAPAQGLMTPDTTPDFTGTCEPFATVRVVEGADTLCTTTCLATGEFTCTSSLLTEGSHTIVTRQVDRAGNLGPDSAPRDLVVDTTLPVTPGFGSPAEGMPVKTATPSVSGTCESGSTVSVYEGSTLLCSASCSAGAFTCVVSALADGDHELTVKQTDGAGNTSTLSDGRSITVDTVKPNTPTLTSPLPGVPLYDDSTLFTGAAEPGSTIQVKVNGQPVCTATVDANGAWTCSAVVPAGQSVITVTTTDAAGNTSTASAALQYLQGHEISTPTISSPGEGERVTGPQITVSGAGSPGTTVTVSDDTGNVVCTAEVDMNGTWTCSGPLPTGDRSVTATASWNGATSSQSAPTTTTTLEKATLAGGGCDATGANPMSLLLSLVGALGMLRRRRR